MITSCVLPKLPQQTARLAGLAYARRTFASSSSSLAASLLYLEHRHGELNQQSLVALTAAKKIGGDIHAVVAGDEGVKEVADKASK